MDALCAGDSGSQARSRASTGRGRAVGGFLLVAVVVGGCGATDTPERVSADRADAAASTPALDRVAQLDAAVQAWAGAADLAAARSAAEAARNLVLGPAVEGYGDADGDGTVSGASDIGLLPDERGGPGLVPQPAVACVERDVLGGSWADPAARWSEVRRRIAAWRPDDNTFPALPSHPQRVVGWASLTLTTDSVEQAHEYAGHAALHVRVARAALDGC